MRRLSCRRIILPFLARFFLVGGQGQIPEVTSLPTFGSRRKRRMNNSCEKSAVVSPLALDEEEAKSICFEKYGFLQKPLVMSFWSEFLRELRTIEFSWTLVPSPGGAIIFTASEHGTDGKKILCSLKGTTGCAPIAEFFECCGNLTQGICEKSSVRFFGPDGSGHVLEVVAKRRLSEGNVVDQTVDKPILPVLAQYNCRGTSVDVSVTEIRTSVVTSLFCDLSLQTFNYAFLTSIPVFLKRTDVGIRNVDFVSKDQMRHFRFAWCFLRRESLMTAVEMSELDLLLPP